MKTFVAATLAFLSFVRAEEGSGSGTDGSDGGDYHDGDREYHDELDPCTNYTSAADCLSSTETEDERGLRLECAWVARRHTEYCWMCTPEEIDVGECRDDGENCESVDEEYACGGCQNIFSGEAFSDYTCAEVRERRYGQGGDGDEDLKIFCRDDVRPVPDYLDYRCKGNDIPYDDKEKCHEAMCQAEMDACFEHVDDYNCSDLAKNVWDDEKQWQEDCDCWFRDGKNRTKCEEKRDWCRDHCPGQFREEEDGYECREVAMTNIAYLCADNETEKENYAEACALLKDMVSCDMHKCNKGFCSGDCTQQMTECMFASHCWEEWEGFEDFMAERGVDPGEGGGGPFMKYELRKTADDYCAQLDAGVCVDELNTLFDCALEHCLKTECLIQDCDAQLQTCYDSVDCMAAANFSIHYLFPDDNDNGDGDKEEGGNDRRRLVHATDECCKEGCQNDFWDNCQWPAEEFSCDLCQDVRCCDRCHGEYTAYCPDEEFDCGQCEDGHDDDGGGCEQPRRQDDDHMFLMVNYLKWWYEYKCASEGRFCDDGDWSAALECGVQEDGACAVEFGRKNKCFAEEQCTEKVMVCFYSEDCGAEFDKFIWYEDNCDRVNRSHLTAEELESCFGWEEDFDDLSEVSFQQYQCWRDGGCTQEYEDLWACIFPCMMKEDGEGDCHWSEDDQRCHCKHDDDVDGGDDDEDDGGECVMDGCSEEIAACFFDEDCYSAMDHLFNDYNISHLFQWFKEEMSNEDCTGISEQEITDWYEDNFCTQPGVTCNALFQELWKCFITECVLEKFPCWYDSCFGLVCECFYDDECSELGRNAFGDDDEEEEDEETRRLLVEAFVTTEGDDKHFFDIFEDIDVPDEGSAQDAADWVVQVYTDACADASGCGNQMFEDAIECIATECVHTLPDDYTTTTTTRTTTHTGSSMGMATTEEGNGPRDDSALAASTIFSFLSVLFAAML